MSDFDDLFPGQGYGNNGGGVAYARRSDPETSHDSAEEMRGKRATQLEMVAYNAIKSAPDGLTNHELVEVTGYPWNTITPRIAPLVAKGLVYDSGNRRKGPAGRYCIVWKAI